MGANLLMFLLLSWVFSGWIIWTTLFVLLTIYWAKWIQRYIWYHFGQLWGLIWGAFGVIFENLLVLTASFDGSLPWMSLEFSTSTSITFKERVNHFYDLWFTWCFSMTKGISWLIRWHMSQRMLILARLWRQGNFFWWGYKVLAQF